jgi:molybdate transport system ATP-binding protein
MNRLHFDCRLRYPSGFELNIQFEAGEGVTALYGPSGSGKSTVLSLIAGIQQPDDGVIRLGERVLIDTRARTWLKPEQRKIGFVFQNHLLFPHMSVEQNLRFGLGRASSRAVDFERVVQILEIGQLLRRAPHTLSGGQQQRVALGRAILRGPKLLLMDEPLTGLDEGLKDRVLSYLERALAEWRMPTLFVSHDQADVRRLAEAVVVLDEGKVIETGPIPSALDRAILTRFDQRADHRPSLVNLLRVTDLQHADDHWVGSVGKQTLHLPPGLPSDTCGPVTVQFLARDVVLSTSPIEGTSARNHLAGQVREVVSAAGQTFVAVDVGQFLWAEVTPEAARELNLLSGCAVTCHIKTSAMQWLR